MAHCLVKLSLIIFTRRIFSGDFNHEKRCFGIATSLITLYGIASLCLSSVGCHPRQSIDSSLHASCGGTVSCSAFAVIMLLTRCEDPPVGDCHNTRCRHRDHCRLPTWILRLEEQNQKVEETNHRICLLLSTCGGSDLRGLDIRVPSLFTEPNGRHRHRFYCRMAGDPHGLFPHFSLDTLPTIFPLGVHVSWSEDCLHYFDRIRRASYTSYAALPYSD